MKKAEAILREALAETGAVIPLKSSGRGGTIDYLCKQMPGHESRWLSMVESLLQWAETAGVQEYFLVARKYLLKDGKMVFGWYIRLEASSATRLQETCQSFAECLQAATRVAEDIPVQAARPALAAQAPQVTQAPKKNGPSIQIVKQWTDDNGKQWEESVMPLPHAHKDLNIPSKPVWSEEHGRYVGGSRGAKSTR